MDEEDEVRLLFESLKHCLVYYPVTVKNLITKENVTTVFGGHCVLTYVCWYGPDDPDILLYCVGLGASVQRHVGNKAPIHFAAQSGKCKLVRTLIDLGVSVNQETQTGSTVLDFTLLRSNRCTELVLDAGGVQTSVVNLPQWAKNFINQRKQHRTNALILIGLKQCRSKTIGFNGKDVMRVIARCIWSMRGWKK